MTFHVKSYLVDPNVNPVEVEVELDSMLPNLNPEPVTDPPNDGGGTAALGLDPGLGSEQHIH